MRDRPPARCCRRCAAARLGSNAPAPSPRHKSHVRIMSGRLLTIVWDGREERAASLEKAAEFLGGLSEQERQAEFAYQARIARAHIDVQS